MRAELIRPVKVSTYRLRTFHLIKSSSSAEKRASEPQLAKTVVNVVVALSWYADESRGAQR